MEAYYYNHMSKVEQVVYHAMKTGVEAMAPSFLVPRMEAKELAEVFFRMRLDCPEIFWAVGFQYRSYRDSGNLEILPEYLFEKSKVRDHQKAMKARVEKLVRPAMPMKEREKEQFIHDFICQNVRYDKLKKPYSHEIIGPLGQGVGVCEGIAKTVKILCEPVIWKVPACSDGDRFYYKEKKISFTKVEEVKERAAQAAKKGRPFLFHWRGGYLTKEVLHELLGALDEAAKEKHLRVSLNWPQAVLYAEFSDTVPEHAVVI